jgi:hypothetical protein
VKILRAISIISTNYWNTIFYFPSPKGTYVVLTTVFPCRLVCYLRKTSGLVFLQLSPLFYSFFLLSVEKLLLHDCILWENCSYMIVYCGETVPTWLCTVEKLLLHDCVLWGNCSCMIVYCGETALTLLCNVEKLLLHDCVLWSNCFYMIVYCGETAPIWLCTVEKLLLHDCLLWRNCSYMIGYCWETAPTWLCAWCASYFWTTFKRPGGGLNVILEFFAYQTKYFLTSADDET